MALGFDAVSDSGAAVTGTISWTHTPVGTPRAILVFVTQGNGDAGISTGATYGGVTMTEVSGSPVLKTTGEAAGRSAWFLGASIPTGAQTVEVTVGNANNKTGNAVSITGDSADLEIIDVETWASDSLADPSATLSLSGRSAFCLVSFNSGQNTQSGNVPFTNWTNRFQSDLGTETTGIYTYDIVSTADVTAGWTMTAEDATGFAIAVAEVVSGFDPSTNHAWGQQSPARLPRRGRMLPSGVTHIRGPRAEAAARSYLRRYAFLKAA